MMGSSPSNHENPPSPPFCLSLTGKRLLRGVMISSLWQREVGRDLRILFLNNLGSMQTLEKRIKEFISDLQDFYLLSFQLSAELSLLGLKMYTGKVVGISIIREIGPVLTAVVFAGRVGSGIASELGSMVLGHQVDTLRVFGVDPVKKLVTL